MTQVILARREVTMERMRGTAQAMGPHPARALAWSKDLAHRAAQQRAWASLLLPTSTLALVHTIDPAAVVADVKAAVATPKPLFSVSLVHETHHATFFGQRVGVHYFVPVQCIAATSPSDFASTASLSSLEWYQRRGIHTPDALLAAARAAGSWTEVLVEAHVTDVGARPRAASVVALPGITDEEAAFALALGRALGLPVVDVDADGWQALTVGV